MFAFSGKAAEEEHLLNEWQQSLLLGLRARGTLMRGPHHFPEVKKKEEIKKLVSIE